MRDHRVSKRGEFILLCPPPTLHTSLPPPIQAARLRKSRSRSDHWQIARDHNSGGIMVRLMQPITNSESVRHPEKRGAWWTCSESGPNIPPGTRYIFISIFTFDAWKTPPRQECHSIRVFAENAVALFKFAPHPSRDGICGLNRTREWRVGNIYGFRKSLSFDKHIFAVADCGINK